MSTTPKTYKDVFSACADLMADMKTLDDVSPRWDPNWLVMLEASEKEAYYGILYKFLVKLAPERFDQLHFDKWEHLRIAQRMFSNL